MIRRSDADVLPPEMKICKLILMVSMMSLFAQACEAELKLPKEMPEDIQICFSDHKEHQTVCIRRVSLVVTYGFGWHNRRKQTVTIATEEAEKLYQTLIENDFDQMKNDTGSADEMVNRSISMYSSKINMTVHQGILPLSSKDQEHFETIRQAVLDLARKHAPEE